MANYFKIITSSFQKIVGISLYDLLEYDHKNDVPENVTKLIEKNYGSFHIYNNCDCQDDCADNSNIINFYIGGKNIYIQNITKYNPDIGGDWHGDKLCEVKVIESKQIIFRKTKIIQES